MFADKEKFVTSAYKQKMLAMQEEEERERREAAFEGENCMRMHLMLMMLWCTVHGKMITDLQEDQIFFLLYSGFSD